jgi:hypothetical protein
MDGNVSDADVPIHLASVSIFNKGQWGKEIESRLSQTGRVD